MSDAYWPSSVVPQQQQQSPYIPGPIGKRARSDGDDDNDVPIHIRGIGNVHGGELLGTEGAEPTGASSSRYLANFQPPSHGQRQYAGRIGGEGSLNCLNVHHMIALHGPNPPAAVQEMTYQLEAQRIGLPTIPPLPNSTLFVEGLPANCTKREASRILLLEIYVCTECPCASLLYEGLDIFRPFFGFKDLRIVHKEPKNPRKGPMVLCFVEFISPHHAAKAIEVLQGYKFDFTDPNSPNLKVQFARYQKSGAINRGNC